MASPEASVRLGVRDAEERFRGVTVLAIDIGLVRLGAKRFFVTHADVLLKVPSYLNQIVISDAHKGLSEAICAVLPGAAWNCRVTCPAGISHHSKGGGRTRTPGGRVRVARVSARWTPWFESSPPLIYRDFSR
jgi:hypothetical protein